MTLDEFNIGPDPDVIEPADALGGWDTASSEEVLEAAAAAGGMPVDKAGPSEPTHEETYLEFIRAERARMQVDREKAADERAAAELGEATLTGAAGVYAQPESETDWVEIDARSFEMAVEAAKTGRMPDGLRSVPDDLATRIARVMPVAEEVEDD